MAAVVARTLPLEIR